MYGKQLPNLFPEFCLDCCPDNFHERVFARRGTGRRRLMLADASVESQWWVNRQKKEGGRNPQRRAHYKPLCVYFRDAYVITSHKHLVRDLTFVLVAEPWRIYYSSISLENLRLSVIVQKKTQGYRSARGVWRSSRSMYVGCRTPITLHFDLNTGFSGNATREYMQQVWRS